MDTNNQNIIPWFQSQLHSLKQRFSQGNLHHGLLLTGKQGIGKKQVWQQLSHFMLCENSASRPDLTPCGTCQSCRLFEAGNHPDLVVPEYEKTLGVDLIRNCIAQLSQKSHLGGPMLLILHNVEAMTTASANALLKTLEEPTANTFLLMTTTSQSMLLPTILSRCEKQKIQLTQQQESQSWLLAQGIKVDDELLSMYWDRPLLLKDIMTNEGLLDSLNWLKNLHKMPTLQGLPASLLEEHHFITDWMTSKLKEIARSELSDVLKVRVHRAWQELAHTEQQLLKQGINKPLLLEKLLHSWQQTITLI